MLAFYKAITRFVPRSYVAVALILVERSLLPCSLALTLNKHSGRPNEVHQMSFFLNIYAIL